MKHFLYRVQIIEYPAEAIRDCNLPYTVLDDEWEPEDWAPTDEYIDRFGTGEFIWPTTHKEYKSRSSAVLRKKLLESYGAKCIIQRSAEIVWPADGEEKVPTEKERQKAFIDELIAKKQGGAA